MVVITAAALAGASMVSTGAMAQRRRRGTGGGETTTSAGASVDTASDARPAGLTTPAEEAAVTVPDEPGGERRRGAAATESLEESLYLRERADTLGAAAREWEDEEIERLLAEREGLVGERRNQAIALLEEFVREEPDTAFEMPDALLRLAELRWEEARSNYLTSFAAWQNVPEANRGVEPAPDYSRVLGLYDRILTNHRSFARYDFVLYMKAFALTELGMLDDALAHYRRILTEFPESRFVPDAHMALAETSFSAEAWEPALAEFEQVLLHEESELYDMALFKSAWCMWRLGRTTDAATRFRQVLDLGRNRTRLTAAQRRRLRDLQEEALDYLIQVFTEDENNSPRDLSAFLTEIGAERYTERVLTRLSLTYMDQARFDYGIEAYRILLEMSPSDERAPAWQQQIAAGFAALDDTEHTVEELTRLADTYLPGGPWAIQQTDPEVVAGAEARVERALRVRSMRWHELGQRDNLRRRFEEADRGYELYLAHFPESEHAYDLRFYRAEILFHRLERYPDAGAEYLSAARARPEGEHTRDALYNAIGAFEHVREVQLEACTRSRAAGGAATPTAGTTATGTPPAATTAAATAGAAATPPATGTATTTEAAAPGDANAAPSDPCGESDNDRSFSEAIELYVQLFPDDPDLPEILFRQGRLYYDRGIYDPAVRLFGQLLERFPNSTYAHDAGELILDSFNRAADYGNIETWARRLKSAPAFASAEAQQRLDTLILQSVFARGEQLANRGEHREAAEAFERAASEFPNDPRARQALYNAGLERQRAGDLGGASAVYDRLAERYPGSAEGALGAWNGAQMFESIAQFADAAHFYELYGERFPTAEHAVDSLYNAVVLRLAAGDSGAAVRDAALFLERNPRHELADEVTFLQARAHAEARQWNEAAAVYRDYIESHGRNVDRVVEAGARLAQVLLESGNAEGATAALAAANRTGRGALRRLSPSGKYYLAQVRFMQAEAILRRYEAIAIAGPMEGLGDRLTQKSQLLAEAARAFAEVVELNVAEWVTAALFQIGRSYELYAISLREFAIPPNLTEEEEQAYYDQLGMAIVPIEERALEAYEGGYNRAIELGIYNEWTASLREGLTRLNDVAYPPLREAGIATTDGTSLPMPAPLDGLRRGAPAEVAPVTGGPVTAPSTGAPTTAPTATPRAESAAPSSR
jgi:TolA-binding protein